LLPQVDDVSSLVEQDDGPLPGNPALAVELCLELFPSILAWPEEVGAEGYGSMAWYNLVKCNTDVLLQPQKLQQYPLLLWLSHNHLFLQSKFNNVRLGPHKQGYRMKNLTKQCSEITEDGDTQPHI
jgi:hypothetical protein